MAFGSYRKTAIKATKQIVIVSVSQGQLFVKERKRSKNVLKIIVLRRPVLSTTFAY